MIEFHSIKDISYMCVVIFNNENEVHARQVLNYYIPKAFVDTTVIFQRKL